MSKTHKKPTVAELSSKVEITLNDENTDKIVDDDVWAAVKTFNDENGFNSAQLKHFNLFIYETAQEIVNIFRRVVIEENGKTYIIEFQEIFFKPPYFVENDETGEKLYPTTALQRNITYASALHCDITITPPSGEPSSYDKVFLGMIPVMVLSDLCNMTAIFNDPQQLALHNENFYDIGGYFVVAPKGENATGATAQRRVLGAQEKAAPNLIQVFTNRRKQNPKFTKYAEVKSSGNGMHTTTTVVGILGVMKRISAVLPWIDSTEIPIGVLFKALGVIDDKTITILILGANFQNDRQALKFLIPSLEYSYEINTQESALLWIGKKARKFSKDEDMEDHIAENVDAEDIDGEEALEDADAEANAEADVAEKKNRKASEEKMREDAIIYAKRLLSHELFPHVGSGVDTFPEKAKYLGYMIQKLIWVILERANPGLRDHYMSKRIMTAGQLLSQQFYGAFRRLVMEITNNTRKALKTGNNVNILSWIKPTIITNAMNGAISGNNWSSGGPAAKGISQLYEEFNHASCAANMRKLTVPMAAEGGKVIEPRDLHGSHFGCVCPSETPEGKKAGLVKNMAFTALITVGSNPEPVKKIIQTILGDKAEKNYPASLSWARVLLNGSPLGETDNPKELVKQLVQARRNAKLNPETSIAYFEFSNEVQIAVDAGRLCRPLFVVNNGEMPFRIEEVKNLTAGEMTWTQLLASGMVELIDKAEEENCVIVGFPSDLEKLAASKDQFGPGGPSGPSDPLLTKITHCEFHPSLMYGIGGSIIPFPDHNQCIYQEELVYMADGTKKKIKDVVVGDFVINFYPTMGTQGVSKVTDVLSKTTNKQMWELEAENGATIVATYDHRFFSFKFGCTPRWETLENIQSGDFVKMFTPFDPDNIFENNHFDCVVRKTPVSHNLISDITTDSPNQSFFCGGGFGVHNSPRNCYQASMGKQAIGIPFTNYRQVMSGTFHTMQYLQKPLCLSRAGSIIRFDEMPAGQNAIIAVMPRPYNEEDSIEMNLDAVQRGFMVSYKWTCFYCEIREEKRESFGIPNAETCDRLKGNVENLTSEGFPKSGTIINPGDAVIGKIVENQISDAISATKKRRYSDSSVIYDHAWPARVDRIQIGTTGDGYKYIRVMLCQKRDPIVGDKFCYTPDHDVLTTKGWINITEVTYEHEIASLNQETGELEYQLPTEIVEFDYDSEKDGNMIVVDTNQVNLCVTPNHKMYVKRRGRKNFKLEEAKDLFDIHVHYKKNAEWKVPGLKYFTLPSHWYRVKKGFQKGKVKESQAVFCLEYNLPIKPWLVFFGIWLAEGCAGHYGIDISICKERVETALTKAVKELGYEYKISKDGEHFTILDKQLVGYMTPLSTGSINKQMPEWVWKLNKKQCQLLLESMCLGDGHMNGNTPMYDTSSIKLKDDVIRLALHSGWAANCYIKSPEGTHKIIRGRDSVTNADAWRLTIVKTQFEPVVNKSIKGQQTTIPYNGKVYCFTVPNHVVYVKRTCLNDAKRSQKPVWCGQSSRHGQKGTIGKLVPAIDLPFNSQGISPDIVVNSLAFPSRMTIAMLLEMLSGKVMISSSPLHEISVDQCLGNESEVRTSSNDSSETRGEEGARYETHKLSQEFRDAFISPTDPTCIDATPFRESGEKRIDIIRKEMAKYGFDCGDESMTDGVTGKKLRCLIFFGPVFYQKLKHFAIDKVHGRARGGRTTLFRQPKEKISCFVTSWKFRLSEC